MVITVNNQQNDYDALSGYTLTHGDSAFIHQHIVDTLAAQTPNEHTKSIRLTFTLAGLYLHVEKQFNGRQIQLVTYENGTGQTTMASFIIANIAWRNYFRRNPFHTCES